MLLLASQIPTAHALLERMHQSERSHYEQRLTITGPGMRANERALLELQFNRHSSHLVLQMREKSWIRWCTVEKTKVVVYDPSSNQYEVRKVDAKAGLAEKVSAVFGRVDPILDVVLDAGPFDQMLSQMLSSTGWKVASGSQNWVLKLEGKPIHVTFEISRATYLPTLLEFSAPKENQLWTYKYGGPPLAFHVPRSARLVTQFFAKPSPPHFVDAAAMHLANSCEHAYSQIGSAVIQVEDEDGQQTIYWRPGAARQDSTDVSWSYIDGRLEILDHRKNKLHRGACSFGRVPDYLAKFGVRIAPTLRTLISGQNLLTHLYSSKLTARLAGRLSVGGAPVDILELRGPEIRMQIEIRSDNHLITAFRTEDLDRRGAVVTKSETGLRYVSVNQPLSAAKFQFNSGNALPLPK